MECEIEPDAIVVRLPITESTGKTRIKRPQEDAESVPVACRSAPMRESDYLEWQISYYTDNKANVSVAPGVILRKDGKEFYGCEFIRLLSESRRVGILPKRRLDEALETTREPPLGGFAEDESIVRVADTRSGALLDSGFCRFNLRVPAYQKSAKCYAVEIKIARRQRAVGNQAMVFVHLPLSLCRPLNGRPPFAGRKAEKKEQAEYRIRNENIGILSDVAVAFLLASKKHREDMLALLTQIR